MGVLPCSVNNCQNKNSDKNRDFFYFPSSKQIQRLNAWIWACDRDKNWKPSSNSVVCEDHFNDSNYLSCKSTEKKKKRLAKFAVPHLKIPKVRVFHDETSQKQHEKNPDWCKTNHWLKKMVSLKSCYMCNQNTDWMCGALMCKKYFCLSPCYNTHKDTMTFQGTNILQYPFI